MMRYTITVPLRFNDGALIPGETIADIEWRALDLFGGFTQHGPARGVWRDDEGHVYHDQVMVYEAYAKPDFPIDAGFHNLAKLVLWKCNQKAVFCTVGGRAFLVDDTATFNSD